MAIATTTELHTVIMDMLPGLVSEEAVDNFISLAEASIFRTLRIRSMVRRSDSDLTEGFTEVPGDFLAPINLSLNSRSSMPLRMITPDKADLIRAQTPTGVPAFFCLLGNEIEVLPNPASHQPVELIYYGRPKALKRGVIETNPVLAEAPDLYLQSALAHAGVYINDPQRAAYWSAEAQRLIAELNDDTRMSEYGASPLLIRTRGHF